MSKQFAVVSITPRFTTIDIHTKKRRMNVKSGTQGENIKNQLREKGAWQKKNNKGL